jgi:UDP-N-acetylglucosamine--N-acetylmuramyl-(pentapeptide) pyrophosphoryl-undecaprenol N-acetylglucosamine transferase
MPEKVKNAGVDWENCETIDMREYIYNMPTVMAAADVIISRAGASTCNEIGASRTPNILIPSPNVTNNHQEKNARVLAEQGGSVLILEPECTGQRLYDEVAALLADEQRRADMADALKSLVRTDSTEAICRIVEELAQR